MSVRLVLGNVKFADFKVRTRAKTLFQEKDNLKKREMHKKNFNRVRFCEKTAFLQPFAKEDRAPIWKGLVSKTTTAYIYG